MTTSPPEASGEADSDTETPTGTDEQPDDAGTADDDTAPEVFSREYVERLRAENARHRVKARHADDLARSLVTAYASETGRLHDPTDLPYSEELLKDGKPDRDQVAAAVAALVQAKPHLARLMVTGDVGQGVISSDSGPTLGGLLRRAAG
jgi:hypothetical protein